MPKPSPADIAAAIELVEAGEWIDPARLASTYWRCELYAPENKRVADGVADTAGEAMGLAWIAARWTDALINQCVPPGIPYEVPEGWRFELTPPDEL
jgi:hypothetical protein